MPKRSTIGSHCEIDTRGDGLDGAVRRVKFQLLPCCGTSSLTPATWFSRQRFIPGTPTDMALTAFRQVLLAWTPYICGICAYPPRLLIVTHQNLPIQTSILQCVTMEVFLGIYTALLLSDLVTNAYFRVAVACFAVLLLWRLWRFTVEPLIYPNEPKTYPYWIPCKSSYSFLSLLIQYFVVVTMH